MDLFDFTQAIVARDEGIAKVADNSQPWFARDYVALAQFCKSNRGAEVIGEDIRRALMDQGLKPHHPNAWGALIRCAVKDEYLHRTGAWRSPSAVASHGRPTSVYRVLDR